MRRTPQLVIGLAAIGALLLQTGLRSETATHYRFTFPEPHHHWLAVEATFSDVPAGTLELRMSRSSPGRYSLHDFARNVYDVSATNADGTPAPLTRPDPYGWTLAAHGSGVTVRYKVYGDRIDGTYLAVDETHAHMNMPAVIMWARGLDDRPVRLSFTPPAGSDWQLATQLYPTGEPLAYTAPNLQYLMDSPTELGPVVIKPFDVAGSHFRFAIHHTGDEAELTRFVGDVQRIVSTERDVYGEFPDYEPGRYTFLADYLPWANGDGMEHRNSTVITAPAAIRSNRNALLDTVAHEFFHNWNVERIRPRSLEPFDFERANMSGELWLAEGFTQYYGPLALRRGNLVDMSATVADFQDLITSVLTMPGRDYRSAEEMSRMAPFTDGGRTIEPTNWSNTYISYYPFGGAIALGLDLTLRDRYDGRITLDDFMRAMWRAHGKPGGQRPGYVDHPYTIADAQQRLAEVTSDPAFAAEVFSRYVQGRESMDYARLLARAGFVLRRRNAGQAWMGDLRLETRGSLLVRDTPAANTPAYRAGLDRGDEIRGVDGARSAGPEDVAAVLRRHKPGDVIAVEFADRTGRSRTIRVTLAEDPSLELLTLESTGRAPTPAQTAFRSAWLGPRR